MRSKVSDLLDKINRLANPAAITEFSPLELDLLKQYLRDLYQELDSMKNGKRAENIKAEVIETIQPQPVLIGEKQKEVIVMPKVEEPVVVKAETKVKPTVKSTINEIVQSTESLNSKLKATTAKEVHHKLSTKPLKELIDLNKRFVVVNELFKGNSDAFAQAVQDIDSAENYNSAESIIRKQFADVHQWDESSETVKLFFKLVKQKFGAQ